MFKFTYLLTYLLHSALSNCLTLCLAMPRILVPSPNEEAQFRKQTQEQLKRERLIAARRQACTWSKKRVVDHVAKCKQQQVHQEIKSLPLCLFESLDTVFTFWKRTKEKIDDLENKENELRKQLEDALISVGQGQCDAEEVNKQELERQKREEMERNRRRAAARFRSAMKEVKIQKSVRCVEESRGVDLKNKALEEERERTRRLLENPFKNPLPLLDLPQTTTTKPLKGLDANTKTLFHLPSNAGVVEEERGENAKVAATEMERMMEECKAQLAQSKQAREERADVRGTAALAKVQLKNVLNDVTTALDRYAVINRTKKRSSTFQSNIFASAHVREAGEKQHQIEMEHAVEDVFERLQGGGVREMVLPPSAAVLQGLETIEERSEVSSIMSGREGDSGMYQREGGGESGVFEVSGYEDSAGVVIGGQGEEVFSIIDHYDEDDVEVIEIPATSPPPLRNTTSRDPTAAAPEDPLADESRPSLNLYFPLHSSDNTTSLSVSPAVHPHPDSALDLTVLDDSGGDDMCTVVSNTATLVPPPPAEEDLDLSGLIKEQLKINRQLREMGGVVQCVAQPPPISYTSPLTKSLPPSLTSSIIQEILSSQNSVNLSSDLSSSISQHTLTDSSGVMSSRDTTLHRPMSSTPASQGRNLSSRVSVQSGVLRDTSSRNASSSSRSSGVEELQRQLARINSHLTEIDRIKKSEEERA
uniref:Putative secretory peptide-22 n=1 Tax=Pleurobrachia bachei TaxID=34499 RepID=M4H1D3_PLEBA|nr:putative secretory peptide-22 [Pleurobrachia bachei]|eukprot:sb/3462594/